MSISIKTEADIEGMRLACRLASEVLDMLTPHVKAGVTTLEIDRLAHDYMVKVQSRFPPRSATSRRATRPTRHRCARR
jgi:methionyl aminopeptidase